jgi:hypothetical protein
MDVCRALQTLVVTVFTLGLVSSSPLAGSVFFYWAMWTCWALVRGAQEISVAHAVLVSMLSTAVWWNEDLHTATLVLSVALGYFMWDMQYCYFADEPLSLKVHAWAGFLGLRLATQPFLPLEASTLLMFEWSTPFLYWSRERPRTKWLLWMFGILYLGVRLGWGTWYTYTHVLSTIAQQSWYRPWVRVVAVLIVLCTNMLNWYWGFKVARKVWRSSVAPTPASLEH